MIIGSCTEPVMHTEATMRPRNQKHGDLPPTPERNKPKISREHYVIAAIHAERGIYGPRRKKVMEKARENEKPEKKPHQFAGTHSEAPAGMEGVQRERKMDGERK